VKQAFLPEALEAVALAYEDVVRALPSEGSRLVSREAVAKMLIVLAESGERNPRRLVDRALAALADCRVLN
jgi:hypothetical protein